MSLLQVSNLSVDFFTTRQVVHAVRDVSFNVAAGERVGLVGESGSGKTTTALALMRMLKPPGRIVSGSARVGDLDLVALQGPAIRAARLKTISYIPQGAMNSLSPVLRVHEQMLDGLADHGVRLSAREAQARVRDALAGVGLSASVADLFPHQLSGGMKQRVCIAIAMMLDPQVIIADEPTSALDVISQRQVIQTLHEAQMRIGCGMVIIGHDMGLMAQATDRIIVMKDGRIVEDALTPRLFAAPQHAYSAELIESVPTLGSRPSLPRSEPAGADAPFLDLSGVGKIFGSGLLGGRTKQALAPIDLRIDADRPRVIAVVGQSGSGKTTLARIMLGLEAPSEGRFRYRGQDVGRLSTPERARFRREVQAIFQDPYASFNPFYRVDHALLTPLLHLGGAESPAEARATMEAACRDVGLNPREVLGRFPHELSGGQRQRLMIARALALKPRLIVADEPVSMVDASLRMTILNNLRALRQEHAISVVYITHDLATAYQVSDEVIVLYDGRLVEAGPPERVIEKPEHPYTQALVSAIPWPDPERDWAPAEPDRASWNRPAVIHTGATSIG
ncbi:ABC transporter ATP-binding protein [Bosea sp. AS-1]|uniref:ABC transporter ATP-binding protein n=1 Tax=Bosea sp. AS-1 TaxID=2015316 RepID=UPI0018DFAD75|nr:ABC transporter ATP-binding protein [Bosea sp. AS-1]